MVYLKGRCSLSMDCEIWKEQVAIVLTVAREMAYLFGFGALPAGGGSLEQFCATASHRT